MYDNVLLANIQLKYTNKPMHENMLANKFSLSMVYFGKQILLLIYLILCILADLYQIYYTDIHRDTAIMRIK